MNLFETAAKYKFRYNVANATKGTISTEDLWDLKLEDLDKIAKSLNKEIKLGEEESFIVKKTTANTVLTTKFEIVKHIIEFKLAEKEKKVLAAQRAEKRAQIIELISKKELSAMESKSLDELKAELAELD